MKSKNLRSFIVNDKEMIFNVGMFQELFKKRASSNNMTYVAFEEELANHLFVDRSAVHNWRFNVNGPGDVDKIRQIASFLHVKYELLLTEVKDMNSTQRDNNNVTRLSDREKEALKNVYGALLNYLNTFDATTGFLYNPDGSCYPFNNAYVLHDNLCSVLRCEYIDLKRTVYDELERFFNGIVTATLERYTEEGYIDDEDYEFDGETPESRTTGLVCTLWEEFYGIVDKYLVD